MQLIKKWLGYLFGVGAPALTTWVSAKNPAAGLVVGTALAAIGSRVLHLTPPPAEKGQ